METLPKEILANILGRLRFAELISAKIVCRRFNILCRPIIMEKIETYFASNNEKLKYGLYPMPDRNVNIYDLCQQIDYGHIRAAETYFNFEKQIILHYDVEMENLWLFLLANVGLFPFVDRAFDNFVMSMLHSKKISLSMKKYYIGKYLRRESWMDNICLRYGNIWNILLSDIWIDNLDQIIEIIDLLKDAG